MSGRLMVMIALAVLLHAACGRGPDADHPAEVEQPRSREVRLSEDTLRTSGIEVIAVTRQSFHPHIVASGVIRPVADRSVAVRALVGGRVVRVLADVGERVPAGQVLAIVESAEVTAALARHRTAAARHEAARRALERAEKLLAVKAISRGETDLRLAESESAAAEAEAAAQELRRMGLDPGAPQAQQQGTAEFAVRAPMAGVVLRRSVAPGLLVEREAPLFEIADLSKVWALVDVYEKDVGQVQERGEVEVRTDAYPGAVFTGRVALIEPALDEASRTAHVRVVLDNAAGRFRPGLFVTVAVPVQESPDPQPGATSAPGAAAPVAVPGEAVQTISGLPALFVEKAPGLFELRPVEIGREAHGLVEIRRGLEEGERVVVKGAFLLKSELLKGSIGGDEH